MLIPEHQPGLNRCGMLLGIAKDIKANKEPFTKLTPEQKVAGIAAVLTLLQSQECPNIPAFIAEFQTLLQSQECPNIPDCSDYHNP